MRKRLGIGLVVALIGLLGTAAAAAQVLDRSHRVAAGRPVRAVDAVSGRTLPATPALGGGRTVDVHLAGYAPNAAVTVALVGVRTVTSATADAAGRVVYRYVVPRQLTPGRHVLIFSGTAAHTAAGRSSGNVTVSMPLAQFWPFRTGGTGGGTSAPAAGGPSSPPGHPAGSSSAGASAGDGTRGSGTSSTGSDLLKPVALGLLALVAGGALARAARRRPRRG